MPRTKPIYEWKFTEGKPLKHEPVKKRTTYKQGGKKFKESSPPASLPTKGQGVSDVHYGSHKTVEKEVKAERLRIGL